MKDYKKETEKYILKVCNEYIKKLLLEGYIFELIHKADNSDSIMESEFHYPYLTIVLHYSENAVDYFKKNKLKPIIIHELCHVLTDPLYAKAIERYSSKNEILDERERLTDMIASLIIKNNI